MIGSIRNVLGRIRRLSPAAIRRIDLATWEAAGEEYARHWTRLDAAGKPSSPAPLPKNPLREWFDRRREGPGVWKWTHYFDAYHRHLSPLRHRDDLVVVEVGIYSGGSLEMWRDYFGPSARIHGVDIEPACKAYEREGTRVWVGDQADRQFWRRFLAEVGPVDVVIDDGGHTPEQQRVTLEMILPHVRPGGVYICEDIHGHRNGFTAFVGGLLQRLNAADGLTANVTDPERRLVVPAGGFQSLVHSVHCYPFFVAVERHPDPPAELVAPKHGTKWEPFL